MPSALPRGSVTRYCYQPLRVSREGAAFVVWLEGELGPEVVAQLAQALAGEHDRSVNIIDLSEVTFIDTGAIRALVAAAAHSELQQPMTILRSPSACVARLFALCNVGWLLGELVGSGASAAAQRATPPRRPGTVLQRTDRTR